jgi:glycosyltransferase involved in cell wall biosynthesis
MKNGILISVIIPTFNRFPSLISALHAISQSNFDFKRLEVIIVDDGSSDNTSDIQKRTYPFNLRYFKHANQGDALARNFGAQQSQGDLLIFVDDDIHITPEFLTVVESVYGGKEGIIIVGTLVPAIQNNLNQLEAPILYPRHEASTPVPFTECKSGLMAIARQDFLSLGMMQPLEIDGSSIWCDVELAYRAYLSNFTFLKSLNAIGYHDDYHERNVETKSRRMYRMAKESILLFQRHPGLQEHLPMFHDKTPISWQKDQPRLIIRKIARYLASTKAALSLLELAHKGFSSFRRLTIACEVLERWIIGGYIYRGYRQGLEKHELSK